MTDAEQSKTTLVLEDSVSELIEAQRAGTTVISKRFTFDAAHYLPNVPDGHKCRRMHGHTYEVVLHVTDDVDAELGWVVDFAEIKDIWNSIETELDHHLLNEVAGLENPTAERVAAWIWLQFERACRKEDAGFSAFVVEVAETEDSRAVFVAPEHDGFVPSSRSIRTRRARVTELNGLEAKEVQTSVSPVAGHQEHGGPQLEDVQARPDDRGIAIDEVGVTKVRVPITVLDRDQGSQSTIAEVTMAVDLAPDVKGTHLSRFIESLREHRDALTLFSLSELTADLRVRLDATTVRARAEFPYFVTRQAPVTGSVGEIDVDCIFEVIDTNGALVHWLEVDVPITTVCPCSRDVSEYGAHNQRGHVQTRVRCANDEAGMPALVWIEELIEAAEAASSSPVYPVIKRPDERHVTMTGFENPQFVEDVVRDVAVELCADDRIQEFIITVESEESIHAHNAFASATGPR